MRILIQRHDSKRASAQSIEVDRIRIGRGADQDVQLPDLRVSLAHAILRHTGKGWLVESATADGIWVNGRRVAGAVAGFGDEIDCGRFRLRLRKPDTPDDLLLEVEERASAASERADKLGSLRLSLKDLNLSKRRLGWEFAILALILGMGLPAAAWYSATGGASLKLWASGPLSPAHHAITSNCQVCHADPFKAVQNHACLACHQQIPGHHAPENVVAAQPAPPCRECHREHEGETGLHSPSADCASCHATPERFGMELKAVSSFGVDHPEFSPQLPSVAAGRIQWKESRSDATGWLENSNLKFSHAVHLDKAGIDSASGKRVLNCSECHQKDRSETGFRAIQFSEHCASCHKLSFDPAVPRRELPHGQTAEVAAILLDFYMVRALEKGQSRRAAQRQAEATLDEVIELRVCGGCHVLEREARSPTAWKIEPVAQHRQMFTSAHFSHRSHQTQSCMTCHTAPESKQSRDVLLPDIGQCRECHRPGKAGDACSLCHRYHAVKME